MLDKIREELDNISNSKLKEIWDEISNLDFSSPNAIEFIGRLEQHYSFKIENMFTTLTNKNNDMTPKFSESSFFRPTLIYATISK